MTSETPTKRMIFADHDGPRTAATTAPGGSTTTPSPTPRVMVPGVELRGASSRAQRGVWDSNEAAPLVREQLCAAGATVAPAYATAQDKVRVEMRKAARQAGLARLYRTAWGELPSE